LLRHKLLSSGVTKGVAVDGSGPTQIVDPARRVDPLGFRTGYTLRLLDHDGQTVAEFDRKTGTLRLTNPPKAPQFDNSPERVSPRTVPRSANPMS